MPSSTSKKTLRDINRPILTTEKPPVDIQLKLWKSPFLSSFFFVDFFKKHNGHYSYELNHVYDSWHLIQWVTTTVTRMVVTGRKEKKQHWISYFFEFGIWTIEVFNEKGEDIYWKFYEWLHKIFELHSSKTKNTSISKEISSTDDFKK